jgi:hypothetical protein
VWPETELVAHQGEGPEMGWHGEDSSTLRLDELRDRSLVWACSGVRRPVIEEDDARSSISTTKAS